MTLAKELLEKEKPDYKSRKKEIHAEIEAEGKKLLTQMGLADRMDKLSASALRRPVPACGDRQSPCAETGYPLF